MIPNHEFDWDPKKDTLNLKKHRISFDTAMLVFDDPNLLTKFNRHKDGEERWHTIGYIERVLLVVVHTYRMKGSKEISRIISARKASNHEKFLYRKGTR